MIAEMQAQQADLADDIRSMAHKHGFERCHFAAPELNDLHGSALDRWVMSGMHGDMAWMGGKDRLGRQKHPASMLPGVRTVICVAMRYSPPIYTIAEAETARNRGAIAAYAHGNDYHDVMKRRLKALARDLDSLLGPHEQRVYVDTAPVLEHALAERAGLGWQGKHSLTLNRQLGSWFFLGELFTTAEIKADDAASFHCGTCSACIDICPTRAIIAPFVVDARLCISYLTIEHKGSIPRHLRPLLGNRIYGCDDCQMVCPWNNDVCAPQTDFLAPRRENWLPELASLLALDDAGFRTRFAKSPVKRIGRQRFLRNCCVAAGNSRERFFRPALWALSQDDSNLVRGHAVWALGVLSDANDASDTIERLTCMLTVETDNDVREEISLSIMEIKEKI
jgi:epoxyqueuosine reductase